MEKKHVIFSHLYNDFSGSPNVLSQVAQYFIQEGYDAHIITSDTHGFLSDIKGASYTTYNYRPSGNKLAMLCKLLFTQLRVFIYTLRMCRRDTVVYVNTLYPFGAALAGKLMGCRVIYHIHETSINPALFKESLKLFVRFTASKVIFVSKFLHEAESIHPDKQVVIHNALSYAFIEKSVRQASKRVAKNVLMICSLREYKGVNEFISLAWHFPKLQFRLVLNATEDEIKDFIPATLPRNLTVFPAQSSVYRFYEDADLVLNLSRPDEWVETFGMTILEAMQYGLPCIVPDVGGPTELVSDGENGYLCSVYDTIRLHQLIRNLSTNSILYQTLSANAWEKARYFSPQTQKQLILGQVAA